MTPRTEAQEARNTTRHHIGERRIEDALPGYVQWVEDETGLQD